MDARISIQGLLQGWGGGGKGRGGGCAGGGK